MSKWGIKYLDLFSGIGGFARGIEQAGIKIEKHYFSEIDKNAKEIYTRHWPQAEGLGPVGSVDGSAYEPFDLITFGFPCQDISVAGRGEGLSGARSNLFFEATRIVRENKPCAFIFENVKGLFSSNGGKDFEAVLQEITDVGLYECQWQLLNTSWFLPQNRERVYFVGCLREGSGQQIFPIGEGSSAVNSKMIQVGNIDTKGHNSLWGRVYSPEGDSATLTDGGGLGAKTGLYAVPVLTPDRKETRQEGRRFKEDGDDAFTLTGQDRHGVMLQANCVTPDAYLARGERKRVDGKAVLTSMHERRIRRLTPTECERLQGFPDGWTEGTSDSQRYKCLGNAVTTNVVQAIMEKWKFEKELDHV